MKRRRRKTCAECGGRPQVLRPKNDVLLCRSCFLSVFEREVHEAIYAENLFGQRTDVADPTVPAHSRIRRVCIGLSGGKDSMVLTHVLHRLNQRHSYGLDLQLVCVDEGLVGYRDECLVSVRSIASTLSLPLTIVSFDELFHGWTMDRIVEAVGFGTNSSCSFCGVFRRKALDVACARLGCDAIVTGHNADDLAETILMNFFRGDLPRLERCLRTRTRTQETPSASASASPSPSPSRIKPLNYMYEKEIVLYAHYNHLPYFSTECKYYTGAFRSVTRDLIKDLERVEPHCILDIIQGSNKINFVEREGEREGEGGRRPVLRQCEAEGCQAWCSQRVCRACVLLGTLDRGEGLVGIYQFQGKISSGRRRKIMERSRDAKAKRKRECEPVGEPVGEGSSGSGQGGGGGEEEEEGEVGEEGKEQEEVS